MFFEQLLVCCQCPNPKSLNNHCHGRSSQGKTIHYLINSHKLPSPPPYLVIIEINFIVYLSLSLVFLQCWKSLCKKHLQYSCSLPVDQADLETVQSADCPKFQERQCTRSRTGIATRKSQGLFHLSFYLDNSIKNLYCTVCRKVKLHLQ